MFPDYRKDQATSVSVSMPSAKVQYPSTMTSMPLRSKRNRNFYRLFKEHSNYVHLGHIRNGSLVRDERENRYSQHFDRLEHCILHNIDLHNCVVQDSTLENCNLVSYCMDACSINSSSIDTCQVQDSVFFDCKFRPGGLCPKILDLAWFKVVGGTLYTSDVMDSNVESVEVQNTSFESSFIMGDTVQQSKLHCCNFEDVDVELAGLGNEITTAPLALKKFPIELRNMIIKATLSPSVLRTSRPSYLYDNRRGPNEESFRVLVGDTVLYQAALTICASGRVYLLDQYRGRTLRMTAEFTPNVQNHVAEVRISSLHNLNEHHIDSADSAQYALPELRKLMIFDDYDAESSSSKNGINTGYQIKELFYIVKAWLPRAPLLRELVLEIRSRRPLTMDFDAITALVGMCVGKHNVSQGTFEKLPDPRLAAGRPHATVRAELLNDIALGGEATRNTVNWKRLTWSAGYELSLKWAKNEAFVALITK